MGEKYLNLINLHIKLFWKVSLSCSCHLFIVQFELSIILMKQPFSWQKCLVKTILMRCMSLITFPGPTTEHLQPTEHDRQPQWESSHPQADQPRRKPWRSDLTCRLQIRETGPECKGVLWFHTINFFMTGILCVFCLRIKAFICKICHETIAFGQILASKYQHSDVITRWSTKIFNLFV